MKGNILKLVIIMGMSLMSSCRESSSINVDYVDKSLGIDTLQSISDKVNERNKEFMKGVENTINGDVVYIYRGDSLINKPKKVVVFKVEDQKEHYTIYINNDTIKKGDSFIGMIRILKDEYQIHLWDEKDEKYNIVNDLSVNNNYKHVESPQKPGTHNFKGLVRLKDQEYPFEYKYIVTE